MELVPSADCDGGRQEEIVQKCIPFLMRPLDSERRAVLASLLNQATSDGRAPGKIVPVGGAIAPDAG
jgi:hypothetical protein